MINKKNYTPRKNILIGLFCLVGIVFLTRLFYLQVVDDSGRRNSDNNVFRYITQYPARGKIFDRNGNLLVYNEAAYDLMVVPNQVKKFDTASFCRLLHIEKEYVVTKLNKAKRYSRFKPSVFLAQLSKEEHGYIVEMLYNFPGFYFQTRTLRRYPSPIAAHILGDIGEVGQKEIDANTYYKLGDYIGKSGIERSYENELRGKKGMRIVMVDVHNREKGSYENGKYDTLPVHGNNLYLGLDAELQQYGELLMQNKIGSIVAIEPSTGQILAMVNSPTFDPNLLVGNVRGKNYKELLADKRKPLINRAVNGLYPPGSTFKMLNGLISLQRGSITPNTSFPCNGKESTPIRCTHDHGSPVALASAIENSCNPYFWHAFRSLLDDSHFRNQKEAYEYWREHVLAFGLGKRFDTDIPFEQSGNIPTKAYFDKLYHGKWNSMTIRSLGIGQGEILLTPLQLANMTAAIGNEGYYYLPHFIRHIEGDAEIDTRFKTRIETGIDKRHFYLVKQAMRDVFEGSHGTARFSKIDSISAAGKTGTAENPHGKDHSLFIAFAPVENPTIAIAVVIENAGFGSTWAAPIASLMMEKYIKGYTTRIALEKQIAAVNLIPKNHQ
ncbi:MAG: penicillin-binding protein 2 [Lentimicrobiaceae bacterium]|jgi:penicillin-binding protein 2|nr:penicillin-binding protein 2 [Lentimicrobiaceae bacterium]